MLDITTSRVNGIDLQALDETVDAINKDSGCANVQFRVKTEPTDTRWTVVPTPPASEINPVMTASASALLARAMKATSSSAR